MGFSNDKIIPQNNVFKDVALVVFNNVRSSSMHISNRSRECYRCMEKINKGENYINHQFKYDERIITISFHKDCF